MPKQMKHEQVNLDPSGDNEQGVNNDDEKKGNETGKASATKFLSQSKWSSKG